MLTSDMTNPSRMLLEKSISDRIAPFGRATTVTVMMPGRRDEHAIAAVRMSSLTEARDVAKALGGTRYSSIVVFKLPPQQTTLQSTARTRSGACSVATHAPVYGFAAAPQTASFGPMKFALERYATDSLAELEVLP